MRDPRHVRWIMLIAHSPLTRDELLQTLIPLPLLPIPNQLLQLIPLLDAGVSSSLISSTTFTSPSGLGLRSGMVHGIRIPHYYQYYD